MKNCSEAKMTPRSNKAFLKRMTGGTGILPGGCFDNSGAFGKVQDGKYEIKEKRNGLVF